MKKNCWRAVFAFSAWLLVMGAATPVARAQSASAIRSLPSVSLTISNLLDGGGTTTYALSLREAADPSGEPIWISDGLWVGSPLVTPEFSMSLRATLDPDPSIAYTLEVIDFGAPTTFIFGFFTPIVPTGSPNEVEAHIAGSLTDARGDGITLTPLNSLLQGNDLLSPATNAGVDVGPADAHDDASSSPGSLFSYGPYSVGPLAGPGPGPWEGIALTVAFGLDGDNDVAEFTGGFSIVPSSGVVPEPGSWLAVGALATGLVGATLRRRIRSV